MNSSLQLHRLNMTLARGFRWYAIGVIIIVAAAGFLLLLQPKLGQVQQTGVLHLEQTKQQLEISQRVLLETESLVQKYEQLNAQNVQKLLAVLPSDPDLPDMFVQIEALALTAGLKLNNVNFAPNETQTGASAVAGTAGKEQQATAKNLPANMREMGVSFSVTGGRGYASLKDFLQKLESSVRLLDLQSLSYTPGDGTDAETYTVNAVTYYAAP